MIGSRLSFLVGSLKERLWVQPLGYALFAVAAIFAAGLADNFAAAVYVPQITAETNEKLLTVISASMLVVATFAVASMVSAYASAGASATPRAFALVITDSVSQTALSSFIGAFIFSIVGIIAVKTGYYGSGGRFVIFLLTLAIFVWVVLTFVRWVDNIARLGRLGNTIEKAERATTEAFRKWPQPQSRGGVLDGIDPAGGRKVFASEHGYIQHIDIEMLQDWAEQKGARVQVLSRTGAFVTPRRALLTVDMSAVPPDEDQPDFDSLAEAFVIAETRTFSDDPRFGLIVLSEIASRALSPAVNDPGTAIDIINRLGRILLAWDAEARSAEPLPDPRADRVDVPPLVADDLFEDAFAPIARDGAGMVEVGIRLQKTLGLLAQADGSAVREAAIRQASLARQRAEETLTFAHDLDRLRRAADQLPGAVS